MADYLALTNMVLRESGITLDALTTSNFASPPDPIFTKFKQWVAQAWEDIQTERRDWEFMQGSGVTIVNPKIEVYGAYSTGGLVADLTAITVRKNSTSADNLLVLGALTGDSATDSLVAAGTGEGSITWSLASGGDEGFMLEPGDLLINAAGTAYMYFRRFGRYSLSQTATVGRDTTTDLGEIKRNSLAVSDIIALSGETVSYQKLSYVPPGDWLRYGFDEPSTTAKPKYYTESANGELAFYPPLDTTYNIYFEHTKTPQTLSAHSDTPTNFPSRFHNAIAWLALMYWADYEGNGQQFNRAKNRYDKFHVEMIRDLLPPVKMNYDVRDW